RGIRRCSRTTGLLDRVAWVPSLPLAYIAGGLGSDAIGAFRDRLARCQFLHRLFQKREDFLLAVCVDPNGRCPVFLVDEDLCSCLVSEGYVVADPNVDGLLTQSEILVQTIGFDCDAVSKKITGLCT